jgi:hypothetical protein
MIMTDERPKRTAPYVGLEPFDEQDQAFFFGRDAEAAALADEILANPVTILFAPSGAGKSSLLRARIIPDMRKLEAVVVYVSQWLSPPVAAVRGAVAKAIGPAIAGDGERNLLELAHALRKETGQGLVLVLDQFEQFFLHHADQMNPFGAELAALARAGRDAHLVFALREEFLPRLDAFREPFLGIAQARHRLGPLSEEHAREAIVKPLTVDPFRGAIEPALVTKLLGDLRVRAKRAGLTGVGGDTGISLPILQIVCRHLWDASPGQLDRQLTVAHYDELDGCKGVIDAHVRETMREIEGDDRVETANVLDLLAPRSGVKMAYNVDDLSQRLGIARARLDVRLAYLESRRIVHIDQDGQVVELFHDAYTEVLRGFIDEVLESARREAERRQQEIEREAERRQQEIERKAARRRRNQQVWIAIGMVALLAAGASAAVIYRALREPARLEADLHKALVMTKTCGSITDAVQPILAAANRKVSWVAERYSADKHRFLEGLFGELANNAALASQCPELRASGAELGLGSPVVLRYNGVHSTSSSAASIGNQRALELRPAEIQNLWQRLVERLWDEQQIALATTISVLSDTRLPAWSYALEVDGNIVWRRPLPEQQSTRAVIEWSPPHDQIKHLIEITELFSHIANHAKFWIRPRAVFSGISVFVVPAWSAPVWQQFGQRYSLEMVSGVEASMAFDVFEFMAGQPELYLTEPLTRSMIALRQQKAPCLVFAALDRFADNARRENETTEQAQRRHKEYAFGHLLSHVHRALVEAARQGYASGALTRILDRLADLPAGSPEGDPRAVARWLADDDGRARLPAPIVLSRRRQPAWTCPRLVNPLGFAGTSLWNEVASRLESREDPIRVRVGRPLVAELGDSSDLRPETHEMLYKVQHDLWATFGVELPDVRFAATAWPEPRYRIEIPGRNAQMTDAASPVLAKLSAMLHNTIAATRMATITVDRTLDSFVDANRSGLYSWMESRFSRNDIKLLLRGVLAPPGGTIDGAQRAPTIRNLPWLLGSLPFWELACDGAGKDECLAAGLRETENARRAHGPVQGVPRALAESIRSRIADGVRALVNDKPDEAVGAFRAAVRQDRNQARQAFLHVYGAAELARAKELCGNVPAPGRRRRWGGNLRFARAQIEEAIEDAGDSQNRKAERVHLRLCALMYQLPTADEADDARKIQRFLERHKQDRVHWTAQERYWLGFQLVDANARVRPPVRPSPADRTTARDLLEDVLGEDGLDARAKVNGFAGLLEVCEQHHSDRCFWDLSEIAEKATLSTKPLLMLVENLLELQTSGTRARLDRIAALIERAVQGLHGIENRHEREQLSEWFTLVRLNVALQLLSYDGRDAEKLLDEVDAFRKRVVWIATDAEKLKRDVLAHQGKLAELRASLEESKRRWPRVDFRHDELELALREGRIPKMAELADALLAAKQWKDENYLFLSAIAHMLVNDTSNDNGNAERWLLSANHPYRDYVRLILYWRLVQRGEGAKAAELLEQRRLEIPDAHDGADARLADGDLAPWRDLLVSYYLDPSDAKRENVLDPVKDRASFDASLLSKAGQSYSSFRCEAFFYDALRQSLTGEPTIRHQRYVDQLTAVVRERCFDTIEYYMASWLLQQPATL